ncbi:MAG TPA: transglutaminase-like domain-containing protein [Pirellulaceae bacterium]|nr:transglutaminase-like domain-containing protein [Pirellulaceae bacterium]
MIRRLACVFAVCSVLPATTWAQFDTKPADAAAGPRLGEAKPQNWEFGVSIRAVGGPSAGLFGTFPVPADWPEQQVKVVNEEITPQVRRTSYRTTDGLKQCLFDVPRLAPGETATCFLTLEIAKSPQQPPVDSSGLVVPKDPPREVRKYLGTSPHIESTNSRIRNLARELTAAQSSAWEQVSAVQAGVRERIAFEADNKDDFKGAADALRDGKADKEDMTAVFVALCRAAKIPARMVWVLDYCYAEFYLEDAAGKGAWYPCVVHEQANLGEVKDTRPILQKGDNFRVPESKETQWFVAEYLTGKGGGGQPSVEFRRRSAD